MGRKKKCRSKRNIRDAPAVEPSSTVEPPNEDVPFTVATSDVFGRYLVAKRDLKPGEVVMTDQKLVVGPCQDSKWICIGCFVDLNLDRPETFHRFVRCGQCSWPLCSVRCPGSHATPGASGPAVVHTIEECTFLAKSAIKGIDLATVKGCFYAITPLRLLMMKEFNPRMWKVIEGMEAHMDIRRKNEKLWRSNEEMVVDKIKNVFGLSTFTSEEIHFACGVLEVNAFEVTPSPNAQPLRAVYPNAYLFAHDCVPNTCHSNGEGFSLIVRTMRTIPKNTPLTVSYTYTLQSTINRRKHLLETKFFHCNCDRCRDVTEFGVYCSAVKCPKCRTGIVLPINPLDSTSEWKCGSRKCPGYKVAASVITKLSDKLSNELDAINGNDIKGYEDFLKRYSDTLHENHYLCLSALHSLFQLYGKIRGYIIDELTEEQLERKIEICKKLLRVFAKLEPGLSKQRGILLYELQAPLMVILRQRFEQQNMDKKELKQRVREVNKCLEETVQILGGEWRHSPEGVTAAAAKEALESMKNWESVIDLL